jgi:hypothetical protein
VTRDAKERKLKSALQMRHAGTASGTRRHCGAAWVRSG